MAVFKMAASMRLLVATASGPVAKVGPNLLLSRLAGRTLNNNGTRPYRTNIASNLPVLPSSHGGSSSLRHLTTSNKGSTSSLIGRRNYSSSPWDTENVVSSLCSRLSTLGLGNPGLQTRTLSTLLCSRHTQSFPSPKASPHLVLSSQPCRTVVRFSKYKGKKKTVHAVIDRFFRLENGLWVRTQSGRAKKLWKKSPSRRYRLKQHVFCNKTQSKMLDRMVSGHWKKRRYFLDDPFEKYHERNFDGYKMWHCGQPKPPTPSEGSPISV